MKKIHFKNKPNTDTPITDGNLNLLQENVEEAIEEKFTYSSEEKVIGNWMGKPLYSKIVSFKTSDNMNSEQSTGVSDIEELWIDETASFISDRFETLPINWYYGVSDYCRTWIGKKQETQSVIRVKSPSTLGLRTMYIVLNYTKTTD